MKKSSLSCPNVICIGPHKFVLVSDSVSPESGTTTYTYRCSSNKKIQLDVQKVPGGHSWNSRSFTRVAICVSAGKYFADGVSTSKYVDWIATDEKLGDIVLDVLRKLSSKYCEALNELEREAEELRCLLRSIVF